MSKKEPLSNVVCQERKKQQNLLMFQSDLTEHDGREIFLV